MAMLLLTKYYNLIDQQEGNILPYIALWLLVLHGSYQFNHRQQIKKDWKLLETKLISTVLQNISVIFQIYFNKQIEEAVATQSASSLSLCNYQLVFPIQIHGASACQKRASNPFLLYYLWFNLQAFTRQYKPVQFCKQLVD